jgi:hypothetical protein
VHHNSTNEEGMEKQYKDAAIVVSVTPRVMGPRWRSSCAFKFLKDGREAVEHLKLDLDYDTPKQAERLAWYSQKCGLMPGNLRL